MICEVLPCPRFKRSGFHARSGGYTASQLGASGGSATLYLETVSDPGGVQAISIEATGASDEVKIFPLTLQSVSRDKYLAGSFEIPACWDDLSVSFVNTSSQENLGTYGNLTGSGTAKIYDSVDDIMNDADILAGSQAATQKIWFFRICRTLSCAMGGSYELMDRLCELTGIDRSSMDSHHHPIAVSPCGKFSVEFAECLASCGTAPVCLVNDDFHEGVSPAKAADLLAKYGESSREP